MANVVSVTDSMVTMLKKKVVMLVGRTEAKCDGLGLRSCRSANTVTSPTIGVERSWRECFRL